MEDKLNELSFVNAILFGVLLAVAYWFLVFENLNPQNQIQGFEQNIATIKGEIAKLDREIKKGQEMEQEVQTIQKKAEKVYKYIPKTFSLSEASSNISEEARRAGLSIQSISTQNGWNNKEYVSVGSAEISVQGSFKKLMFFFSELTRKDKIYIVKGLEIREPNASQGSRDLNVRSRIEFFRRYEPPKDKR